MFSTTISGNDGFGLRFAILFLLATFHPAPAMAAAVAYVTNTGNDTVSAGKAHIRKEIPTMTQSGYSKRANTLIASITGVLLATAALPGVTHAGNDLDVFVRHDLLVDGA